MSNITATCTGCNARLEFPPALTGRTVRCRSCKTEFVVPAAAPPSPATPLPATAHQPVAAPLPAVARTAVAAPPPAAAPLPAPRPSAVKAQVVEDDEPDEDDDRPAKSRP